MRTLHAEMHNRYWLAYCSVLYHPTQSSAFPLTCQFVGRTSPRLGPCQPPDLSQSIWQVLGSSSRCVLTNFDWFQSSFQLINFFFSAVVSQSQIELIRMTDTNWNHLICFQNSHFSSRSAKARNLVELSQRFQNLVLLKHDINRARVRWFEMKSKVKNSFIPHARYRTDPSVRFAFI